MNVKQAALMLVCIVFSLQAIRAQSQTINFPASEMSAREAFGQIKSQTPYGVVYNGKAFDDNQRVKFSSSRLTVAQAMDQIVNGRGFTYTIQYGIISIVPASPQAASAKPAAVVTPEPTVPATPVASVQQPARQPAYVQTAATQPIAQPAPAPQPAADYPAHPYSTAEAPRYPKTAIKTNLLADATTTINLGMEFGLGRKTTLDVPVSYNPWTFSDNRKWKHILVQPELRLWTCERFNGLFFGLHAHYAFYNVSALPSPPFSTYMNEHRFEGWLAGAGVSIGYQWIFSPRWSMEATVGGGYAYMSYDKFECEKCGEKLGSYTKNYFGPTKVGISLIYIIK